MKKNMIKQFENLTFQERELLLKAPALVSVLASCSDHAINKASKADALKLAHLRTYTAFPELLPYYAEVEKLFKKEFDTIARTYYPFGKSEIDALKAEIDHVDHVIEKLDWFYAKLLHKSLDKYALHVKKAAHSVFENFVFPFRLKGVKF